MAKPVKNLASAENVSYDDMVKIIELATEQAEKIVRG